MQAVISDIQRITNQLADYSCFDAVDNRYVDQREMNQMFRSLGYHLWLVCQHHPHEIPAVQQRLRQEFANFRRLRLLRDGRIRMVFITGVAEDPIGCTLMLTPHSWSDQQPQISWELCGANDALDADDQFI